MIARMHARPVDPNTARNRRFVLAIFLALTGFYLLTLSGHTYSADEETMYLVTRGIATAGDVAITDREAQIAALRPGGDGRGYSPYGILPSLAALPLFALGALAAPLGPAAFDYATRFAVTALNAPVTAATAALLAWWALRLGIPRRGALLLALLYALATFAWPYTRTFFSEPLAALLLLLAAERSDAAMRAQAAGGTGFGAAGLAAGLLLATRLAAGVTLPILALGLIAWPAHLSDRRAWLLAARVTLRRLAWWGLGLVPGLALVAGYNYLRFGTLLATGYAAEAELFTTPLIAGLYGLLLSPGKSLLLYAPPVVLALPGALWLWRRGERRVVLLATGLFLSHLLLYARWGEWFGGGVWGPRFLLPVLPLLMLLAGGVFGWLAAGRPGGLLAAGRPGGLPLLVGLLGLAGFIANLGGVALNFNTYLVLAPRPERLYSWTGTPLVAHWAILGERIAQHTSSGPHCALGAGFFAPETDDPAAALPRRSGASASLHCVLAAPGRLVLDIEDYRPPGAPQSELRLALNGRDLGPQPAGQARIYRLSLPGGRSSLQIQATTWNPQAVGFSERDDNLGVLLRDVQAASFGATPVVLLDTAIAPLPERPRQRWAWYFDPPNQHLVDHWAWYLPRSELAGPPALVVALVLIALGGSCLVAGWWLGRTARPPP